MDEADRLRELIRAGALVCRCQGGIHLSCKWADAIDRIYELERAAEALARGVASHG